MTDRVSAFPPYIRKYHDRIFGKADQLPKHIRQLVETNPGV